MVKIMNADAREIVPAIHVIAMEETANWCEEIRTRAGRLFSVYLYDRRRHVHACELTPSYELHFYKTVFTAEFPKTAEGEQERDDLEREIMLADAQTEPVSYLHVHETDALPSTSLAQWSRKHYRAIKDRFDDGEELHDKVMNAMLEIESVFESDYDGLIRKQDWRTRHARKRHLVAPQSR